MGCTSSSYPGAKTNPTNSNSHVTVTKFDNQEQMANNPQMAQMLAQMQVTMQDPNIQNQQQAVSQKMMQNPQSAQMMKQQMLQMLQNAKTNASDNQKNGAGSTAAAVPMVNFSTTTTTTTKKTPFGKTTKTEESPSATKYSTATSTGQGEGRTTMDGGEAAVPAVAGGGMTEPSLFDQIKKGL
mmetsp:Transcript_33410/g.40025  ORF Transcript_33410/g.40025 Transcript_33410/m.40025 type:complete len:183 (-) Transcript_33410:442-990(-)